MSSIFYGGKIRMQAVDINENKSDNFYDHMDEYPYNVPKIYLEGHCEDYFPQCCFSWSDDQVVMARDNFVVEYNRYNYAELLAEDENGNIVWLDGRSAPYSDCWGGKYLNEDRAAHDYRIVEYDLNTSERKVYKMVLDNTSELSASDYHRLSEFVDADILGSHMVDLIVYLLGEPKSVTSFLKRTNLDGVDFEDNNLAVLEYDNALARIFISSVEVNGFGRRQFVVCGSQGTVEIKPIERPCYVSYSDIATSKTFADCKETQKIEEDSVNGRYDEMMQNFAEIVRGKENPFGYDYELKLFEIILKACGKEENK